MMIKSQFLYILIAFYAIIILFSLIFSDSGIVRLDKKMAELREAKIAVEKLEAEINQMNIDIERLQKDREYLLSSAKSYGYLEAGKEKIIRILDRDENSFSTSYIENTHDRAAISSLDISNTNTHKTLSGFVVVLLTTIISVLLYLLIKYKINVRKRVRA